MKAQVLHNWHITPNEARQIQLDLATMVSKKTEGGVVRLIAGVDVSAPDDRGQARAAVVVLQYPEFTVTEIKVVKREITFPYVPGLLSFREAPLILAAFEALENDPDLIMVDGQGIAHPRRMGLASHLGLLLNRPAIGCAKSRLCGTHSTPDTERSSYSNIMDREEIIGAVLRTKNGVRPVYISIGHKIDLASAIEWVLNCCDGKRLPEPTRLAHLAAAGRFNYNSIIEGDKHQLNKE